MMVRLRKTSVSSARLVNSAMPAWAIAEPGAAAKAKGAISFMVRAMAPARRPCLQPLPGAPRIA
ncbi:MAG: hypothetical protein ACLFQ5_10195 [Oceanicaulis sp.]